MERYNQECNEFSNRHTMENVVEFQLQLDLAFHEHDWWKHCRFHHDNKYLGPKLVEMSKMEREINKTHVDISSLLL